MKTAFDSSAFAKRYIEEAGSQEVDEICLQTDFLGICVVCVPEILSALNRRLRERALSEFDYQTTKNQLLADIQDAIVFDLTPGVIARCTVLLENNVLRAMDSLHVACALEWQADLFVSSDHRQLVAAQNAGLAVRQV